MKRLFCGLLALCLLLCACGGQSAGTTAPAETTAPAVQSGQDLPVTEPPVQTIPVTEPGEMTLPTETCSLSSTVRIEDPETPIYAGPAMVYGMTALVEEAGVYTIVEEALDADGNTWGRLKSGAGWICLTEPALAPIYADYAQESFNAYHAYWSDETDYITAIGFTPGEKLTDVKFGLLDWFETESWQMSEVLYTMDELDPDRAFLAQVVFWGDMTTYGISFTDADGAVRHFAVSISGKDGSLICQEYVK